MYVRITRFKPIEHWRDEVIKELDIYMEWIKIQPGFSFGMRLFPLHHPDEVARLTVWEDRSYADHAATSEHALAMRSDLTAMTMDLVIHEEEFDEQPLYGKGPAETEEPVLDTKRKDIGPSLAEQQSDEKTIIRRLDLF